MLHHRTHLITEIIARLAIQGHRLPKLASAVVKKIWLLLDMTTNGVRTMTVHRKSMWSDEELLLATMFFIKLDMHFMHPVRGKGETTVRTWAMGQKSLEALVECLRDEKIVEKMRRMGKKQVCGLVVRQLGSDEEDSDGDDDEEDDENEDHDLSDGLEDDEESGEEGYSEDDGEESDMVSDSNSDDDIQYHHPNAPLPLTNQPFNPRLPPFQRQSSRDSSPTVFGIPAAEAGQASLEAQALGSDHLLRPDELVLFEAIRRGLDLDRYYLKCMLWGWVDMSTAQDVPLLTEEEVWRELGVERDPWWSGEM